MKREFNKYFKSRPFLYILRLFLVIGFVGVSVASVFPYSVTADSYLENGERARFNFKSQSMYADDLVQLDNLDYPGPGIFVLRDSRTSFRDKPDLEYIPLTASGKIYSTDIAVVIAEKARFSNEEGKTILTHSVSASGDELAVFIDWEYRTFSDGYSRFSRKISKGPNKGVYDGEPLDSAGIISVIPLSFLHKGTNIDMVSVSGADMSLNIPYVVFSDDFQNVREIFNRFKESFFNISSLRYCWRTAFIKDRGDKKIVEKIIYGSSDSGKNFLEWDGINSLGILSEPGTYTTETDVLIFSGDGGVRLPTFKHETIVKPYPRLYVANSSGEIIADSRVQKFNKKSQDEKLNLPYEHVSFPIALSYALNRIYMRRGEDTFKIFVIPEGNAEVREAFISSDIRNPVKVSLFKNKSGEFEGHIKAGVSTVSSPDAFLAFGPEIDGVKSFAFFDVTYPEDSENLSAILKRRGWRPRGEFNYYDEEFPGKDLFFRDFIISGGMEKLIFSAAGLSAKCMMKNQASLFYYSGHGWGDGSIYTGNDYFYPDVYMEKGDWNEGLEVVVFSSCSAFDIMNLHKRKFTDLGVSNYSPGEYWEQASGPSVSLLGYNWSTFEGKPPNAFDTRVAKAFLKYFLSGQKPVDAWFNANFANNETVAPCAIYDKVYYYVSNGAVTKLPSEKWSRRY